MDDTMKARLPQGYGGGAASNMQGMLKQAQKMQAEIARVQAELEEKEHTVSVGGGAVEVVMTGKKELKALTIQPEVVDPEDIEMLQLSLIHIFSGTATCPAGGSWTSPCNLWSFRCGKLPYPAPPFSGFEKC